MFKELVADAGCAECGFALWVPVVEGQASKVGIYNDARFPGRTIVALRDHFDSLEEVPAQALQAFLKEIRAVSAAIRAETGAARVNLSILGNRDPHVHAHLIPRFPDQEQFPTDSPWKDPRELSKLSSEELKSIRLALLARLGRSAERKSAPVSETAPHWPLLFTDRELFAAG